MLSLSISVNVNNNTDLYIGVNIKGFLIKLPILRTSGYIYSIYTNKIK